MSKSTQTDGLAGPDRDAVVFFAGQVIDVINAKKAVLKRFNGLKVRMKAAGIAFRELETVLRWRDNPDPDAVVQSLSRFRQYARALGMAVGKQLELIPNPKSSEPSRLELIERAELAGEARGLEGKLIDEAYAQGTDLGQAYHRGWERGQLKFAGFYMDLNEALPDTPVFATVPKKAKKKAKAKKLTLVA